MSWKTITVDGYKCYKSCDGEIVNSTEAITALEDYRRTKSQERRDRDVREARGWFPPDEPIEPMTRGQQIFVCLIVIVFSVASIINFLFA